MTDTPTLQLPPGLEAWGEELSSLSPNFAISLGPLVRRLDEILGAHDLGQSDSGPIDGYDGLTSRGPIDRMIGSEWLLASEMPMEFLRRAVNGELMYLALHHQGSTSRGRVAALLDVGPDQLGVGRLVQLAAILVLHRRAIARSTQLAVGLLGQHPAEWSTGQLSDVLQRWLVSRTAAEPQLDDVTNWTEAADKADEIWVLCGPRLAHQLTRHRRVLSSAEASWDSDGVRTVRVRYDGITHELPVPRRELSIRALRGQHFRRAVPAIARSGSHTGPLRYPFFPSADRRLIARGDGDDVLIAVPIPNTASPSVKVRQHRYEGAVLAAASFTGRLVALVARDGELRMNIVGKTLRKIAALSIPWAAVGMTTDHLTDLTSQALSPIFYESGDILWQFLGQWWRLSSETGARVESAMAVGVGRQLDQPRLVRRWPAQERLWINALPGNAVVPRDADLVFGPPPVVAWSNQPNQWHIVASNGVFEVSIEDGATVLAAVVTDTQPALITVSESGRIVRVVGPASTKTLTRWSGGAQRPAIHPMLPIAAFQRESGTVEVAHLETGELICIVRASP